MERSADLMIQAEADLLHARNDVAGEYYEWACFSAQQAAEKAVNAVFQRIGAEAWGDSVADLLQELPKRHAVSERLRDAALELDKAYIPRLEPHLYTEAECEAMASTIARMVETGVEILSN